MATAAFGVITNSTNQILLVKLAEPFRNAHMWNFPGGVIENGEDIQAGLEREILEETNTKVTVTELLDTFDTEDPENTIHIFTCNYISGVLKYQTEELEDIGWFSYEEALKLPLAFNAKDYIERLSLSRVDI